MTMYVRALASISINVGDDDEQRPEFRLDKNATKVLPLWVAQEPGFQRLWAANKVQVATDSGFTNIITTIPDSETQTAASVAGLTGAITASALKTALGLDNVSAKSIVSVTSSVTLGAVTGKDYIVLIGASGAPILPTAVGNGAVYTLKNVHTSSKTVTTTSSQTIEGSTTYVLPAGASITVVSDNANWRIV
jgi:hypothetical protein